MEVLLGAVNIKRAAEGKKEWMWNDSERYPGIIDAEAVGGTLFCIIFEQ